MRDFLFKARIALEVVFESKCCSESVSDEFSYCKLVPRRSMRFYRGGKLVVR